MQTIAFCCITASVGKTNKKSACFYSFAYKIQYIDIIQCSKIFSDIYPATKVCRVSITTWPSLKIPLIMVLLKTSLNGGQMLFLS